MTPRGRRWPPRARTATWSMGRRRGTSLECCAEACESFAEVCHSQDLVAGALPHGLFARVVSFCARPLVARAVDLDDELVSWPVEVWFFAVELRVDERFGQVLEH